MPEMSNRVRRFADRLGRKTELEIKESFLLQLNSDRIMNLTGCDTVSLCTTEEILLQCRYGTVRICGADLRIPAFSESDTVISGRITDISFSWEA